MARTEVFTCDLGAADGGTTRHRLALDAAVVDIDLCAGHLAGLEGLLAEYLAAGRAPRKHAHRTVEGRRRSAAIRAWAVDAGLLPADARGRLPIAVVAKYDAAHDGGAR